MGIEEVGISSVKLSINEWLRKDSNNLLKVNIKYKQLLNE
jgi:hypothetical protein